MYVCINTIRYGPMWIYLCVYIYDDCTGTAAGSLDCMGDYKLQLAAQAEAWGCRLVVGKEFHGTTADPRFFAVRAFSKVIWNQVQHAIHHLP